MAHKVVNTKDILSQQFGYFECRYGNVAVHIQYIVAVLHSGSDRRRERGDQPSLSLYHQLHSYVTEVTNFNSDKKLQSQLLSFITLPL